MFLSGRHLLALIRTVPTRIKEEFFVERHSYTGFVLYDITGDDLDNLERETLTISEDFSFASIATAVAISFSIALATTTITSQETFNVFWIVTILGYVIGLYFGIRWLRSRKNFKGILHKIRQRGGTLGEEGKELRASELADLPSEPGDRQ
jgi:hypothetical protein